MDEDRADQRAARAHFVLGLVASRAQARGQAEIFLPALGVARVVEDVHALAVFPEFEPKPVAFDARADDIVPANQNWMSDAFVHRHLSSA
jgi:hypothetical protein